MDQSNRYAKAILNTESITQIANQVSRHHGKKLNAYEATELVEYCKKQRRKDWQNTETGAPLSNTDIRERIAYAFYVEKLGGFKSLDKKEQQRLKKMAPSFKYKREIPDIHEIMKLEIGGGVQNLDIHDPDPFNDDVDEDGYPSSGEEAATSDEEDSVKISKISKINNINKILKLRYLSKVGSIDSLARVSQLGNIERIFGVNDTFSLQEKFNPQALLRSVYITLDSKNRSLSTIGRRRLMWDVLNNANIEFQGSSIVIGNVRDIVSMKIRKFRIPNVATAVNSFNKITLLIEEWLAQSFIATEGRRYHFSFMPMASGSLHLDLLPLPDTSNGIFNFRKPITRLDTLTLSFGAPLSPVLFGPDRFTATAGYAGAGISAVVPVSPALVPGNQRLTITSTIPHNLVIGETVIISGYTSQNPAGDQPATKAIVEEVNNVAGLTIVAINSPTSFDVQVPLANSVIVAVPAYFSGAFAPTVEVFIAKSRIIIDLELIYKDSGKDF